MPETEDKTILITGSTDGIGELTARKLAVQGNEVLIHGRNEEKANHLVEEIRADTDNRRIDHFIADFSSLDNVRSLADKILSRYDRLDVLINNAGIGYGRSRQVSEDGHELRFAVNYLAPFLLTHLLLPALRDAAPSRIVNVSSAGQQPIDFDDVMLEESYGAQRAYNQSKLALIMFTIALAEQLQGEQVTVNSLHPGSLLDTKLVRKAGISPMGKAETGAEAEAYLATAPELDGVTGKYFDRKSESKAHAQAYNAEARQKLWNLSKKYTGLNTR